MSNDILKNLAVMGAHLKSLKAKMDEAETIFKQARTEYEHYAHTVLPMEMFSAGVSDVTLADGGKISCTSKFYCQPNKNDNDRAIMAEWLRNNAGEDLIKSSAKVDGTVVDKLKAAAIPFTEIADINTNSLKAFLRNGVNNGQFEIADIPDCIHFTEVSIVEIDA